MLITLNFLEDSRNEIITYTAFANYSYKKEIIETLKAKAKRTNKKI
jgi:hypothetical protein